MAFEMNGLGRDRDLDPGLRKYIEDGIGGDALEALSYDECIECYRFLKHDRSQSGRDRFEEVASGVNKAIRTNDKHRTNRHIVRIGRLLEIVGVVLIIMNSIKYGISVFPVENAKDLVILAQYMEIMLFHPDSHLFSGSVLLVGGISLTWAVKTYNRVRSNRDRIKLIVMICSHRPGHKEIDRILRFARRNGCRDALYYYEVRSRHSEEWCP